jgi:hypothetical protein
VDAILGAEEFSCPTMLAPAVHEVERWADALEQRVRRERPALASPSQRRQYRLVWHGAKIDPDQSNLMFPGSGSIAGDAVFHAGVR